MGGRSRMAAALALVLAAACGPRELPPISAIDLGPAPAGLVLGDERREVIVGGEAGRLSTGGEPGRLLVGAGGRGAGLTLEVDLVDGGKRRRLLAERLPPGRYYDRLVTVPEADREAAIEVRLAGCGDDCGLAATAFVPAARARRSTEGPPNVLVVLTDTLRADALGAYGGGDGRTPTIDDLARRGTRFDQARAQAPWTLPSVASLFTSLWSYEPHDWSQMPQHLPSSSLTMAELFAGAGFTTACFSAHPLISHDTGFGQGFGACSAPSLESLKELDAEAVAARVAEWLAVHQHRPFFAYVHLFDPHAPYCPSASLPEDPEAPIPGDIVPFTVDLESRPDPEQLAALRRLYAEEVAVVDRGVARILESLAPAVRERTIVVFLSDHGEEFMDHGWLGHAWSLFDELLRVPLIVVGPGIPAGRVVAEPVGLIDLLPTLLARAGIDPGDEVRRRFRGIDLSDAFAGRPLPAGRTLLAETTSHAPIRVSVQLGPIKAMLYNRSAPWSGDPAASPFMALLPQQAVFDLAADPGERVNLADRPERRRVLESAREVAIEYLTTRLPGRWTAVRAGGVTGSLRYAGPVEQVVPLFARPGDEVSAAGSEVRVRLGEDAALRAWLVPGRADLRLAEAALRRGGEPLAAGSARGIRALAPGAWAEWPVEREVSREGDVAESVRRLRALGYIR